MAAKKCPANEKRFNGKCFLNIGGSGNKAGAQSLAKQYAKWGYNVRTTSKLAKSRKGRIYTVWRSHDKPKKKVN